CPRSKTARRISEKRCAASAATATTLSSSERQLILLCRRQSHKTAPFNREDRKLGRDDGYRRPGGDRTLFCASRGLVGPGGELPAVARGQSTPPELYSPTIADPFRRRPVRAATVRRAHLARHWLRRRPDRRTDVPPRV